MEDFLHSEKCKGYTIKIFQDLDAQSPDDWDSFGHMVHWHRRGFIGQDWSRYNDIQDRVNQLLKQGAEIIPVYLYEHSGQTISAAPFSCPWDSGKVGFIYCTREEGQKEFGRQWRKKAHKLLLSCIKTWDDYLTGNIYGYVVEDAQGDEVESCWGFYGDYAEKGNCLDEAKSICTYLEKQSLPLLANAGLLDT